LGHASGHHRLAVRSGGGGGPSPGKSRPGHRSSRESAGCSPHQTDGKPPWRSREGLGLLPAVCSAWSRPAGSGRRAAHRIGRGVATIRPGRRSRLRSGPRSPGPCAWVRAGPKSGRISAKMKARIPNTGDDDANPAKRDDGRHGPCPGAASSWIRGSAPAQGAASSAVLRETLDSAGGHGEGGPAAQRWFPPGPDRLLCQCETRWWPRDRRGEGDHGPRRRFPGLPWRGTNPRNSNAKSLSIGAPGFLFT